MAKKPAAPTIRVGLCNPNQSIRYGKSLLINSQPDMQIVFEAATPDEVLAAIDDLTLDVLVIDHRLSGRDGVWLVETINKQFFLRQEWPPTTIVTAPYFAVELDIAVMRSGAADFVVEESGPEQLLAAIRSAGDQEHLIDLPALTELFLGVELPLRGEVEFNYALESLDTKAASVLNLFEAGLNDFDIAAALSYSELRVRQLFRRILIHFGFTTREQLALALYEAGRLTS